MLGFTAWIVIMPLDASRFGWTAPFPWWLRPLGVVGLIKSFYLFFRSYADNTFLSPLVRIQTERKQTVVSTGVYGFVRHPMYLAGILMFLGAPLLLGSLYGLLTAIVIGLLLAGRIIGEERLLVSELAGYQAYRKKVKFRLIPFLW